MFEYTFLVIAFYLSILSYYLGVLLYMIPLPFYGIKKWAPILMVDGAFSAVLIFSYTLILNAIDYFSRLLGVDWNSFFVWIGLKTSLVVMLIVSLKFIGLSLSLGGLQFLANSIISSLINSLMTVMFLLLSISIASTIILTYGSKILALGILLFATPFRITRSAGSMIISIIIVFSIGLPLMPIYVEILSQAPSFSESLLTEYGIAYGYINIVDLFNSPVYKPVAKIYTIDEDIILAQYIGDSRGVINALSPEKGFPSSKEYIIYIEYGGLKYRRVVDPERDYLSFKGLYNLSIKLPVVKIDRLRFIYPRYCIPVKARIEGNSVLLEVKKSSSLCRLFLNVYRDENAILYVDNVILDPERIIRYEWYGVKLKTLVYNLDSTSSNVITVKIDLEYQDYFEEPSVKEINYVGDSMGLYKFSPTDLVKPVVYIVFNLFVAPLTYVAILFSTSIGLARVLGGALPSLARVILTRV